jgi:TonB family protein
MIRFRPQALALLFLIGILSVAHAQVPSLPVAPAPSAPAAPAKPSFKIPASAPEIPKGPPPAKEQICFAPPEGIYTAKNQQVPADLKGPTGSYVNLIAQRVFHDWDSHLTIMEKNSWAKGRVISVRLAVFPDGTYDRPEVTTSSGRPEYDSHVLHAIEMQSTFPAPPKGLDHPLPICLIFGYNADGSQIVPGLHDQWQSPPKLEKP